MFRQFHATVDRAREALKKIQQTISLEGFSEARYAEEICANETLSQALLVQEKSWVTKAKIKWDTQGDRNTNYFHTLAKIRRLVFVYLLFVSIMI